MEIHFSFSFNYSSTCSIGMAFEYNHSVRAARATPLLSYSGWGGDEWDASGSRRPVDVWRRPALFALPPSAVRLQQPSGFAPGRQDLLHLTSTDWGRSADDREVRAAAAVLLRMKTHDIVQASAPSPRKRLRTPEKPTRQRGSAATAGSTPSNKPFERKSKSKHTRSEAAIEPIKTTNPRSKSRFRGVSWVERDQKFVAQITSQRKNTFLGSFRTEVAAGKAYALAIVKIAADPQWTRPSMAQWLQCLARCGVTSPTKLGRRKQTRTLKRKRGSGANPQSPFTGVCWCRITRKWQARCSIGRGKRTHVGFYDCDKDARDAIARRYAELGLRTP